MQLQQLPRPQFFFVTHDLLLSCLIAQSVEQQLIKFRGRGFDSRKGQRFVPFPCAVSHSLTRANAHS